MLRHRLASLALVVLAALTSSQLTGCTAIGFGAGALIDASNGKGTASRLVTVHTGTRVTLWMHDGSRLKGRFLGSRESLSEAPLSARPIGSEGAASPLRAVLIIGTDHGIEQIPIQDVRRVSVPVARGKVIGLVGGLAMDGIALFVIGSALASMN